MRDNVGSQNLSTATTSVWEAKSLKYQFTKSTGHDALTLLASSVGFKRFRQRPPPKLIFIRIIRLVLSLQFGAYSSDRGGVGAFALGPSSSLS